MKYWLFQNNQVAGPFDRDELSNTPGFSAESLVCPEGRKGTQMGDWQRAGVMSELAETLLKMARVPAGAASGGGSSSFLPPEPTLRDLAVLGTLQEKVSLLENSLSSLHEELRAREEEISGLKVELSQKASEAGELQSKVSDLEVKLASADSLRDEVALTKEAQAGEAKTVAELRAALDSVRAELEKKVASVEESQHKLQTDLAERIDKVKAEASAAPARPAPAPAPARLPAPKPAAAPGPTSLPSPAPAADVSLSIPDATPFSAPTPDAAPAMEPPSLEAPGLDAPALDAPPPLGEAPGLPPGLDFGGPTPAPVPLDAPPPFELSTPDGGPVGMPPVLDTPLPATMAGGAFDAPPPSNPFGSTPTPLPMAPGAPPLFGPDPTTGRGRKQPEPAADGSVDLMAVEAKPKSKKGLFAGVAVLLVLAGAGGAWQMGVLNPYLKKFGLPMPGGKAPAPAPAPAEPAPAEPEPPAEPQAQKGLPDRTQEALELAKSYPIPRLGKTLGAVLEATTAGGGLVSPWNVKPAGEGRYEVSFYGKPGRLDWSYEVRPEPKEVRGLNAKSQAVLDGKAPPPAKPAAAEKPSKGRKGRHAAAAEKPAASALSDDPLGALMLEGGAGAEAAPAAQPPASEAPAKPRKSRRAKAPAAEAPKGPSLLDEQPLDLSAPPAEEAPAEEEAPKARRKASAKSKEELTLDELLLPGVPKR